MNPKSKLFLSFCVATCSIVALACAERSIHGSETVSASPATPAVSAAPVASATQGDNAPRIDVAELKALLARDAALILDVRSIDSFNAAHAKGAISYPLDRIEKGDLKDLPKDKRIVAYCT